MPRPSGMDAEKLACSMAAIILHDEKIAVTEDKILAIVEASGVNLPSIWGKIYARGLEGQDLTGLLLSTASAGFGGAAAGSSGGAAAAGGDDGAEAGGDDAKADESSSEADVGAGGLFGDDDDY
eukprot:CAMPEP_0201546398 /NCGR_PEP_ID=MMETSP0173_2-20130828/2680_1 /ASSEMBLY_ACC=CAM_ASM_000268 /TAXON_ID=218659 /ORGANISM="Vexillifera sp., Strain DIVA3 564/2" /LENGTH=123 /DNA_ID=CAMNT_0047955041 /DNA_START=73 /DNA_END=444 /DNA_ORIENTATION=+